MDMLSSVIFASLSQDPFFSLPYKVDTWTKWQVTGTTSLTMTKTRKPSSEGFLWRMEIEELQLDIQLSKDRSEALSLIQVHPNGERERVDGKLWYSALQQATSDQKKQSVIDEQYALTTELGTFVCRYAEHVDPQGNRFRWFLNDTVIGGVVQFEIQFAGPRIHTLRYTLIESGISSGGPPK